MKILAYLIALSITINSMAQDTFYEQIPDYTGSSYSSENIMARMIDGLGFRYYWGSFELTETDLNFKPSEDARTTYQTLQHIDGLTFVILKSIKGEAIESGQNSSDLPYTELRNKTLAQIKEASKWLKSHSLDVEKQHIVFKNGDNIKTYPLWNLINGPIEDAVWHVGQVVTFRRSSGNPLPKGVDMMKGKRHEP